MEFQDMKFKKLMRENKKEDLANLYLEADAEISNLCEIVKGLQKSLEESQKETDSLADKLLDSTPKESVQLLEQMLQKWEDLAKKKHQELMRLKKGVMIHTDGTVAGSSVWIDGKPQHDLTTGKVKINIRYGVQASIETHRNGLFERHWIYGDDPYYPEDFAPAPFRPEDGEGVPAQRYVPKKSVTERDNRQEDFPQSDHPDLWECGSCWSVNPLREEDEKKESLQCPVCRQWTKRKEAEKA